MSWWKNTLTLGKFNKLGNELNEFSRKRNIIETITKEYKNTLFNQKIAFGILKKERDSATKNLFLFKTLVSKIKKNVKDNKSDQISDEIMLPEIREISYSTLNLKTEMPDINISEFTDNFFSQINSSMETILSKKDIKKNDLLLEAVNVGISAFTNAITAVISINREVNSKRKEIQQKTIEVVEIADSIKKTFPLIYAETNRAIEIALLLNKTNCIFSEKFSEINKEIYKENYWTLFLNFLFNRKINSNENLGIKIVYLGSICLEYNKISKSTVRPLD